MAQIAVKKLIGCFIYPVTDNEPVIVSHDPVLSSAPHKHTFIIYTINTYNSKNIIRKLRSLSTTSTRLERLIGIINFRLSPHMISTTITIYNNGHQYNTQAYK